MTSERIYRVRCDLCGKTREPVNRSVMKKEGWLQQSINRDLCPKCSKEVRV